jgi:hypothetical protein
MLIQSDTSWFQANKSLILLLNAGFLANKQQNTYFIVVSDVNINHECTSNIRDNVEMPISVMSAYQPSVTMSRCRYQSWVHINHPWRCRDVDISHQFTSNIRDSVMMSILVTVAHQPSVTMSWCRYQSWLHINHTWRCRDADINHDCTSTTRDNVEISMSVMSAYQPSVTM